MKIPMPAAKKSATKKKSKEQPREKKTSAEQSETSQETEEPPVQSEGPSVDRTPSQVQIRTRPIITLTTDFGDGYYVGAVKGAILEICPDACLVDVTHDVSSHDVLEAAFTLICTYPYFPEHSVHIVVVDPGVGSERRGVIVSTPNHQFVGPDNGVFSFLYNREPLKKVVSIDSRKYFRKQVSATFHGRDIFGPVGAWLARGTKLDEFGQEIEDYSGNSPLPVQKTDENRVEGTVIHVDKFGNVITSISPEKVSELLGEEGMPQFVVNEKTVTSHHRFYAQARPGELFSLVGSSGYYEIAAHRQRAADMLEVQRGEPVELELVKGWLEEEQ